MDSALLFGEVPTVVELEDVGGVPVRHTNNAVYSIDERGRKWVRKRETDMGSEEFLGELLGWLLGNAIGAPLPGGAIHLGPDGVYSWLSESINGVVHWDPSLANSILNPEGLGALLALDAIILNPDRHAGNILLQFQADGDSCKVWGIDQGMAHIAYPNEITGSEDELPHCRNVARGIPIDLVSEGTVAAATRAAQLEPSRIRGMVHLACVWAREPKADVIAQMLISRCAQAETLLRVYLEQLRQSQR